MSWPVRIPALASLLLLPLGQTAGAVPLQSSPKARGEVILVHPLSLVRIADMDFATLGVTTGGTATIDPVSGTMSVGGGLLHLGGTPSPARYVGAALKRSVVNIRIPNKPITLTRAGGTETMSLSAWTLDGPTDRRTGVSRAFNFRVGGTLQVAAGQADGLYTGEFMVEVQYP